MPVYTQAHTEACFHTHTHTQACLHTYTHTHSNKEAGFTGVKIMVNTRVIAWCSITRCATSSRDSWQHLRFQTTAYITQVFKSPGNNISSLQKITSHERQVPVSCQAHSNGRLYLTASKMPRWFYSHHTIAKLYKIASLKRWYIYILPITWKQFVWGTLLNTLFNIAKLCFNLFI